MVLARYIFYLYILAWQRSVLPTCAQNLPLRSMCLYTCMACCYRLSIITGPSAKTLAVGQYTFSASADRFSYRVNTWSLGVITNWIQLGGRRRLFIFCQLPKLGKAWSLATQCIRSARGLCSYTQSLIWPVNGGWPRGCIFRPCCNIYILINQHCVSEAKYRLTQYQPPKTSSGSYYSDAASFDPDSTSTQFQPQLSCFSAKSAALDSQYPNWFWALHNTFSPSAFL